METYLLIKYLKCSTTPEEEAVVKRWLADDPDGSHARQYSDAHFLYEGMLIHGGDHSKGFASVQRPKKTVRRRILAVAASVAAAIAIIAGTGLLTRNYIIDGLSARTETIYVPAGKSMQLTLEDGTQFRVIMRQPTLDEDNLRITKLTLERLEDEYAIQDPGYP